jgi:hypothetical protein
MDIRGICRKVKKTVYSLFLKEEVVTTYKDYDMEIVEIRGRYFLKYDGEYYPIDDWRVAALSHFLKKGSRSMIDLLLQSKEYWIMFKNEERISVKRYIFLKEESIEMDKYLNELYTHLLNTFFPNESFAVMVFDVEGEEAVVEVNENGRVKMKYGGRTINLNNQLQEEVCNFLRYEEVGFILNLLEEVGKVIEKYKHHEK